MHAYLQYTHFTPTNCSPLIISRGSLFYYKASWNWPTSKDVSVSRPLNASISPFLLSIDCNIHLSSYSAWCVPLNDIAFPFSNPLILLHLKCTSSYLFLLAPLKFPAGTPPQLGYPCASSLHICWSPATIMAGFGTYIGLVCYDSQQPVTGHHI